MKQPTLHRLIKLAAPIAYLAALTTLISALLLPPNLAHTRQFVQSLNSPLWLLIFALPLALGLIVQWKGRRFWAWPWACLAACFVIVTGLVVPERDNLVDRVFEYSRITTLCLLVVVVELIGLSAGRLVHRAAGLGLFVGAACWLGYSAFQRSAGSDVFSWRNAVLLTSTAGFVLQALIQYFKYRQLVKRLSEKGPPHPDDIEDAEEAWDEPELEEIELPEEPRPTVNEGALPWKVVISELPQNQPLRVTLGSESSGEEPSAAAPLER